MTRAAISANDGRVYKKIMNYEIDLEIASKIFDAARSDAGNLLTELRIEGRKSLSLQGTAWTNEDRASLLKAAKTAINKKPLTERDRLMRRFERLGASWCLFDAIQKMRELPQYGDAADWAAAAAANQADAAAAAAAAAAAKPAAAAK